ncbi:MULTISPECIES: FAD-dependent oxidoreductase [Streptosporangium]|uniref:Kynurenine 3-monooxygenase n=1 Tax=Streptosporangium brasiliense TaxID=47480 RepID=A0ABT9QWB9_9ACTN|nr:NAD(P)/FAD-dependent oxidoreductase [Streptosporangium brasiliense]MDP9861267.1 kynurenine 3-monooxygenase [Streptosporangium brasiliense]
MRRRIIIVGAGPAGTLLACHLAGRGFQVDVYERRADPRLLDEDESRSINLGLSARGIKALDGIGLMGTLWPLTVPMRGRAIHLRGGGAPFQPYGAHEGEILHSVLRRDLITTLIDHAETLPGVSFHFRHRLVGLDREAAVVHLVEEDTGAALTVPGTAVIGADGAFSQVRTHMQQGLRVDHHQEFLEWGYKELTIPAADDGSARARLEALHVWPGQDALIVAHPNRDNSLTGTLFLPAGRFAEIADPEAFFRERFPDAIELMPHLAKEYAEHPVGHLVSIRTSLWHYRDRVALIGDACHAVYPFYGQGMNAALEDCTVLDRCVGAHPDDLGRAFAEYQRLRKPHTDVLDELSRQNFVELRERLRSPLHLARKKADLLLARLLPGRWVPLYTMISHTTIPYADALTRARRQDAILRWAGTAAGAAALAAVRRSTRKGGARC